MKLYWFGLCLFFTHSLWANTIDSLKTEGDVLNFITKLYQIKYDDHFYTFSFKQKDTADADLICDSIVANWPIKNWEKIDFNQDGLTDLFAIVFQQHKNSVGSYSIYTILDKGDNQFDLRELPETIMPYCHAAMPIYIKERPLLLYRHYEQKYVLDTAINENVFGGHNVHYYQVGFTDTLIYQYGGFIEMNTKPTSNKAIASIFYESEMCYGECPVFKMTIFSDGRAGYWAEMFNDREGIFGGTILPAQLKEIWGLMEYIDIGSLNDNYEVTSLHRSRCKLNILFIDGTCKQIDDYGKQGTLGLARLYDLLADLRNSQTWK
jgi:Domain of unknown function (DUF6438)